ncbi:MAG: XTP/dITP diphosphatase [Syntrophobacterales bacterium]|nr:XTP/dITP diphosphatase [Syntrophobacterales bacterium]
MATRNEGKVREVRSVLENTGLEILSLAAYPGAPEVVEDGRSFFENAFKKAKAIAEFTGETVLADDSGLEVDALDGRPGVYSSRYAGPEANDDENIEKLLLELRDVPQEKRGAAFRCTLVMYRPDGRYDTFEGSLRGLITTEPRGKQGFGYDPVFFVPEIDKTVAEMPLELKNSISHRGAALRALKNHLKIGG